MDSNIIESYAMGNNFCTDSNHFLSQFKALDLQIHRWDMKMHSVILKQSLLPGWMIIPMCLTTHTIAHRKHLRYCDPEQQIVCIAPVLKKGSSFVHCRNMQGC